MAFEMTKKNSRNNMQRMKTENDSNFNPEPKPMYSKNKDLSQSELDIIWPITPFKKMYDIDPLLLINEDLPEESDDEDYRPGPEDLQDQSEEETGRQSVVSSVSRTSALDVSATQYIETFDSNLLVDESANQSTDCLFKVPEENIGQRTRSKLCLSDTPLEIIETAFIPPDITTDMYDFKCDNEDWENFLKEYMQPLSNDTNDPDDDEADPDYNVMAEEEEVVKEELRRDRAVKISRKELRKLMAELFESPDEYSSDEEEEKRVRTEITNKVNSDMRKKAEKENVNYEKKEMEDHEITMLTNSQILLIEQQLRQHVQLTTQHFLQCCEHPLYGKYAKKFKIILATLLELARTNKKSVFNVHNLESAFTLVEEWERYLLSEEGKAVIRHMEKEVVASKTARKGGHFHRVALHPHLMKFMSESNVFMYSLLLPPLGFRCDGPFKVEFIEPEDLLIVIGLDEFTEYVSKNPRWFDKKKKNMKSAIELLCQYLVVTKTSRQVHRHIRNVRNIETNVIHKFFKNNKVPVTQHYVIPFNEDLKKAPKDRHISILPENFREFLYNKEGDIESKYSG